MILIYNHLFWLLLVSCMAKCPHKNAAKKKKSGVIFLEAELNECVSYIARDQCLLEKIKTKKNGQAALT